MNWYIKVLKHYFDFRGRARRKEFLFYALIHISIIVFLGALGGKFENNISLGLDLSLALDMLVIYAFATVIPTLGVMVRRLHDQNLNRFFILLPMFPVIGALVLFVLMCLPGQIGENAYGPDPKQRNNEIDDIGR